MPTETLTQIDQEFPVPPENGFLSRWKTRWVRMTNKQKLAAILTILALLGFVTWLLGLKDKLLVQPLTSPPPALSPFPKPTEMQLGSPSPYATDSGVLKIEENLKSLEQNLQSTDLKESSLMPPSLDWVVGFEE